MLENSLSAVVLISSTLATVLGLGAPPLTEEVSRLTKWSLGCLVVCLMAGLLQILVGYQNEKAEHAQLRLAHSQRDEALRQLGDLEELSAIVRLESLGVELSWHRPSILSEKSDWQVVEVQAAEKPYFASLRGLPPEILARALPELRHLATLEKLEASSLNFEQHYESLGFAESLDWLNIHLSRAESTWTHPIGRLSNLRYLSISKSSFSEDAFEFIKDLHRLEEFQARDTAGIGDEVLHCLSECETLAVLDIKSAALTNEGLRLLTTLPKLKSVRLIDAGVNEGVLRELSASNSIEEVYLSDDPSILVDVDHGYPPNLKKFEFFVENKDSKGVVAINRRLPGIARPFEALKSLVE